MNRKRVVLYAIFAVYQLGAFIFTVMVDGHLDLLGLLRYIPSFKYISAVGIILLVVDLVWFLKERRVSERRVEELERENNELKANLYDFKEAPKPRASRQA